MSSSIKELEESKTHFNKELDLVKTKAHSSDSSIKSLQINATELQQENKELKQNFQAF